MGSSTTAGEGNITAYPRRLLSFLQNEYPATLELATGASAPAKIVMEPSSTEGKPPLSRCQDRIYFLRMAGRARK